MRALRDLWKVFVEVEVDDSRSATAVLIECVTNVQMIAIEYVNLVNGVRIHMEQ